MHYYKYLVNVLIECSRAAEHCSAMCLEEPEITNLIQCIKLDRECADVCILTSRMLERDSLLTNDMIQVCLKVCQLTMDECDKHSHMVHCRNCAEACRQVIESCMNLV